MSTFFQIGSDIKSYKNNLTKKQTKLWIYSIQREKDVNRKIKQTKLYLYVIKGQMYGYFR